MGVAVGVREWVSHDLVQITEETPILPHKYREQTRTWCLRRSGPSKHGERPRPRVTECLGWGHRAGEVCVGLKLGFYDCPPSMCFPCFE